MSSKSTNKEADKATARDDKTSVRSRERAEKIARKKTAEISRERLARITRTKKHRLRGANRVFKYGAKSFARNTWLSLAAIAIMSITLIILSATVIATTAMHTAVRQFESQIDMSVYIRQSASSEEIGRIVARMRDLPSVTDVKITSPWEANEKTIDMIIREKKIEDPAILENLRQINATLPWTLNITVTDISDTTELQHFVENDSSMRNMLDAKQPSYASEDRETINNIAEATRKVEIGGFIVAGIFAAIAMLIVFNTIRMAIFNRKEEIYMMRLVGASPSFIIGPFLVEASLYGVIATVVSSSAIYGMTYILTRGTEFTAIILPTFTAMCRFWYIVIGALFGTGIMIGILSATVAARKYLRVKNN